MRLAVFLLLASAAFGQQQSATLPNGLTINPPPSGNLILWNETHQTIEGFGAAHKAVADLTQAQVDTFYGTDQGQGGYSFMRIAGCEDIPCTTDRPATVQLVAAMGARFIVSWWTPPGAWKTNGSPTNGGNLLPAHYQDFANLIKQQLANYAALGVPACSVKPTGCIYAVSPANEPDISANYSSALWSDAQLHQFLAANLCPTLAGSGVLVFMPEPSGWAKMQSYADLTANDPATNECVHAYAAHFYDNSDQAQTWTTHPVWMTEWSTTYVDPNPQPDFSITNGLLEAASISDLLTVGQAAMYVHWLTNGNDGTNQCLYCQVPQTTNFQYTFPTYTIGNFARFIPPGSVRIGVQANYTGVRLSAYKNGQNLAVVAVNSNGSAVGINLGFSGFSCPSVTPHVTSTSQQLVDLAPISAGSSFSYSLAGQSVTTFTCTAQ